MYLIVGGLLIMNTPIQQNFYVQLHLKKVTKEKESLFI